MECKHVPQLQSLLYNEAKLSALPAYSYWQASTCLFKSHAVAMSVRIVLITCAVLSITGSVSINQSNNPLNGQDGFTQLNTSNQRSFQILTDFVREETQQLRGLIMSQATELQRLQQLGKTSLLPASSCREIKQMYSNSPSGLDPGFW